MPCLAPFMRSSLIETMLREKSLGAWSANDVMDYIGKPFSIDGQGFITLDGTFSPEELEAIIDCAMMERATPKYD